MNGRIYDPFIARFMSPDPFTQDPGNLQGYNRFSYVLNNPMKYVDPSGYKTVSLELQRIINDLMSNSFPHGGSWNTQDGFVAFDNQEQTLNAGLGYLNQHASHTRRSRIVKSAYNHAVALRQSGLSMQVSASFTNETVTFSVDNGLIGINYVEGGDVYYVASSGGPGPEFSGGFWDWANKINHLGQRKWTDPESGMSYYINDAGEITGVYPITGMAPTPGKGVKVLQTGGHILKPATLKGLNLTKQQGKTAIESMKKANGLRNDFHGKILNNGDVLDDLGNYIDNLFDYLY